MPDDEREWSLSGPVKHTKRDAIVDQRTGEVLIDRTRFVTHDVTPEVVEITPQLRDAALTVEQVLSQSISSCAGEAIEPIVESDSPYGWIDNLIDEQQYYDHKKGWVAYRVMNVIKESESLDVAALEYTAAKLGYQPLWVKHRVQELQEALDVEFDDENWEASAISLDDQTLLSLLWQNADIPIGSKTLFQQFQSFCTLEIQQNEHPLQPIQVNLHFDHSSLNRIWFKKMAQYQQELQRTLVMLLSHSVLFTFSCVMPIGDQSQCQWYATRHFRVSSGSPPHYARSQCENGHFIKWISEKAIDSLGS